MLPLVVPAVSLGLSLAGQAANAIGASAEQRRQKKRLGELGTDIAAGRGLSAAESATMANTGMAPTRAMAGSMASELARVQAGSGGVAGGAAMAQARDAMAGQIGSAAEKVGYRVASANQEALGAKRQELEDRSAAQAQRKADITNQFFGTLADSANQVGGMLGAVPGTFNLSGDIEQQAAARRDARSDARAAGPAIGAGDRTSVPTNMDQSDPVGARRMDAAMFLQRNPALASGLRAAFAANPALQQQFTDLIQRGVPIRQALTMLGQG